MSTLHDTHSFLSKRDLTLTESTGMLRDAALEHVKKEEERRAAAERRAARAELKALREQTEQRRMMASKMRRRVRGSIAAVCTLALICGWIAGRLCWPDSSEETIVVGH